MTDLHPDLAGLAFLVGTWEGQGVGVYPTIETFHYAEVVEFGHGPKPFLTYQQRTQRIGDHPEAGTPLHAEVGYLRPVGAQGVEWVIAQPIGVTEIHEGTVDGTTIALAARSVATTSTAKEIVTVERKLAVDTDTLRYELWMGAVGQLHQIHLDATLQRR